MPLIATWSPWSSGTGSRRYTSTRTTSATSTSSWAGPHRVWRYLVDSNVDWGQDLKALKRWIPCEMLPSKMHPDPPRIVRDVQPGELVAISATNLQGVYFEGAERRLMNRFRALTPIDRVGYSIFIFRPDFAASVPVP